MTDTSLEALATIEPIQKKHHAAILSALSNGQALAVEEIADRTPNSNYVQFGKRMVELERAGKVIKTAELHVNRTGRRARKYKLAA